MSAPASGGVVVLGGGRLGSAVARRAASEGHRVLVASRTPRPHPGMWMAWDARTSPCPPVEGASAVIALSTRAPAWLDLAGAWTSRLLAEGARRVVVCSDVSSAGVAPTARVALLRFGALVGQDDACIWPLIEAVRAGRVARIPRGAASTRPLLFEDAARAVLRAEAGVERSLPGPAELSIEEVAAAVIRRFGGAYGYRWWGRGAPLAGREPSSDGWDEEWGPRTDVRDWIDRLPGLRVSAREDSRAGH